MTAALVVTGSRAEYGLLRPVMRAIRERPDMSLRVLVTGAHLLGRVPTALEVTAEFEDNGTVEMQRPGEQGRLAEAAALGRGVAGVAEWLAGNPADVVVVLGDRIEAFAAAAAAAVGGVRVAHLHGGDRARDPARSYGCPLAAGRAYKYRRSNDWRGGGSTQPGPDHRQRRGRRCMAE